MTFGSANPVVRWGVIAGFVGSIAWFGYTMWGMTHAPQPTGPPPGMTDAQTRPAPRPAGQQSGQLITLEKRLDPRLRLDLLEATEATVYKGSGRNIFSGSEPPPEPPDIPEPQGTGLAENTVEQPPQPQGPPPINLKFYGFASKPGEPKKIFLSQGENIFIAGEGDIVSRQYRIVKIGPTSVEIEDVLNNNRQSIPLTS